MSTTIVSLADRLFHAYDIRIDAALLDKEQRSRLFDALAVYAKEVLHVDAILCCRDARQSGPSLLDQAITHFLKLGFTVYTELNPITTCQFYYSCIQAGRVMGVMITASHNPASYTGQKLVGPGCVPIAGGIGAEGGLDAIRTYFEEKRHLAPPASGGRLVCLADQDKYIQDCMQRSGVESSSLSSIKVVADFLSGSAGQEILKALERAGLEVIARNVVPDGSFPSGPPNPILAQSTVGTMNYLTEHPDFDFCFVFDGDGDRVDVIYRGKRAVEPSLVLAFLAPVLHKQYKLDTPMKLGFDPKANPILINTLHSHGMQDVLIPNGHSKIKDILSQQNDGSLVAAVEESAHYYFFLDHGGTNVATESTLLLVLMLLKAWTEEKERFEDLLTQQESVARKREWGYTYAEADVRLQALASVEEVFRAQGYEVVKNRSDGKPLGSTILRLGEAGKSQEWATISQRSSESEEGIARWSVVASSETTLTHCVESIEKIASQGAVGSYYG